jgi:hypothetical protein
MAESGAGGRNIGRVFGPVERWLRLRVVLLGDDVVDGFFL